MKCKPTRFTNKFAVLFAGTFLSLIFFCVDWSAQTTFRAMSLWQLYVNNALLALVLMLPYMLSHRVWVQGIMLGIADCLLIANLMYRRTYFTPIPPESYSMLGNLGDFTASVADSLHWLDLVFLLIFAATLFIASRTRTEKQGRSKWISYAIALAALAATCWLGSYSKGGFHKHFKQLSDACYYNTSPVQVFTPVGYLYYTANETDWMLNPAVERRVSEWLEEKAEVRPYVGLPDSVQPRKNLVVILLESFEGWLTENTVKGKEITPYINSLLRDSTTLFAPKVLSQVGAGRSIDGQLLIFTGLLPRFNTIYSTKHSGNFYPTINKAMREKYGTKSYIFTCDKPITWNQIAVTPAFGYNGMFCREDWKLDDMIGRPKKLSDESFLRQVVERLNNSDLWPSGESRLMTLVTYSGHNPWILPDSKKDPGFDLHKMGYFKRFADYTTMAHYTDAQLKQIVEYIKSRPDWDETLVLITGDHEGLANYRNEVFANDKLGIVSPNQFVPMILLNSPIAGRVDKIVGQYDIYPTILAMLGLDDYLWKGMGQSLLSPQLPGFAVSSSMNVIVGDTVGVDPRILENIMSARRVSDDIIHFDMLRNLDK